MRGKQAPKRTIQPDRVYGSSAVTRFINVVMMGGKKSLAEGHVYRALTAAAEKVKQKPLDTLAGALANVRPALEVRSRRVGGATYQVPSPVDESRQEALALRWIVRIARGRKGKDFTAFLTDELVNAYNGEGDAVKKKQDVERMAEANKAFAHFKW